MKRTIIFWTTLLWFFAACGDATTTTPNDPDGTSSDTGPALDVTTLPTPDTTAPTWTDATLEATEITDTAITLVWAGASDDSAVVVYRLFRDGEPICQLIRSWISS